MKKEKNSITSQKMKLIDIASNIQLDPDKTKAAFMACQLVQATLPHRNPGDDIPAWSRKNGNLTLTIRPGWDTKKKKTLGYPYGTLPRLLLFWITTEAIRTNSPRIELGKSLATFMKKLSLDSSRGGKRSDSKRLQEQMMRLFQSLISFEQLTDGKMAWLNMHVAPKGILWWDKKRPKQDSLWESWIQLGEDFFKAIKESPVPVDIRALHGLKNSSLALDLYSWATYTAYQTQKTGRSRCVSWQLLHEQFGAEYGTIKNFSQKAWNAFIKVNAVYPALNITRIRGGIEVLPSNPAITLRSRKQKSQKI
ncbi:MAG TPA: replication protein RepA [Flavitalea sp.]|nr:replication protein RepA [Flavitalea sp.]